ncbi:nucleoporin NUP42-like isoform X2 [Cylas formicarius]|uniref:nucleoporin NUP42-like isoform X2 n=1 Tax=Cylas formicarius TaxID=197179 RepID=UPI002958C48C|nr:nucleoporin NUP42-like isoform X2 [Cylas formicarius]
MVVCKYFLKGTCKFGSYCHYEHAVPGDLKGYWNNHSTSILRQSNFGVTQNTNPSSNVQSNVDTATLVKSAVNDMTLAEKGGQWLLSCYAPYKEKSAFPGFEDHSFEEIRCGFYEAKNNGTLDQYKQQLQALYHDVLRKVQAIQNPSQEVIRILQGIYNSSASPLGGSIFPLQSPSSNILSSFKSQPSVSPVSGSIFQDLSRKDNQSIFGGVKEDNYQNNIFSTPHQNVFSTNAKNSSYHREPNPTLNIFANVVPTTSSSVFGDQSAASSGITAVQQNPSSVFNSPTSSRQSVFVSPIPEQGQQFVSTNKNIFMQQHPQQSIFGSLPIGVSSSKPLQSAPEKPVTSQRTRSAQQIVIDESLYSREEELTDEEKKWFLSNDMDILKIPEKPPAYSMCFRP